jgi:hypothetical protein
MLLIGWWWLGKWTRLYINNFYIKVALRSLQRRRLPRRRGEDTHASRHEPEEKGPVVTRASAIPERIATNQHHRPRPESQLTFHGGEDDVRLSLFETWLCGLDRLDHDLSYRAARELRDTGIVVCL